MACEIRKKHICLLLARIHDLNKALCADNGNYHSGIVESFCNFVPSFS